MMSRIVDNRLQATGSLLCLHPRRVVPLRPAGVLEAGKGSLTPCLLLPHLEVRSPASCHFGFDLVLCIWVSVDMQPLCALPFAESYLHVLRHTFYLHQIGI